MKEGREMAKRNESALRTFRLDAEVVKGLEEEANNQGATVNGIACKVLRRYVNVMRKMEPWGIVSLPKGDMLEIVNSMDDALITKVASKTGASLPKEIIIQLFGEPSTENFRQFLEKIICGFGGWASLSEEVRGEEIELRLGHTMGHKWSVFLRTYIDAAMRSISGKVADFKYVSDYSLVLSLKLKSPEAS
jgi:hypothetical protein